MVFLVTQLAGSHVLSLGSRFPLPQGRVPTPPCPGCPPEAVGATVASAGWRMARGLGLTALGKGAPWPLPLGHAIFPSCSGWAREGKKGSRRTSRAVAELVRRRSVQSWSCCSNLPCDRAGHRQTSKCSVPGNRSQVCEC